jgi:hypothetical protein
MFNPMDSKVYRDRVLRGQADFARGAVRVNGGHEYDVASNSRPGLEHHVTLQFEEVHVHDETFDELVGVHCSCEDWEKQAHWLEMYEAPGVDPPIAPAFLSTIAGNVALCRHTVAALVHAGQVFHEAPS